MVNIFEKRDDRRGFLETTSFAALSVFAPKSAAAEVKAPAGRRGKLVLLGGAMTPRDFVPAPGAEFDDDDHYHVLAEIADEAGGLKGKTVVVVMCASNEPNIEKSGRIYGKEFLKAGAERVVIVSNEEQAKYTVSRKKEESLLVMSKSEKPEQTVEEWVKTPLAEIIKRDDTAVTFFAGGDQGRLVKRFGSTEAFKAMVEHLNEDEKFVVAGTSAGAAAMAKHMIYKHRVNMQGFNLISNLAIDTHTDYLNVGKIEGGQFIIPEDAPLREVNRIKEAIRSARISVGVGIPEGVGVVIQANGDIRVIGHEGKKATFVVGEEEIMVPVKESRSAAEVGLASNTAKIGHSGGRQ